MTFNRKLLLAEAVQSILHQTLLPQKIVIIDNHSTDGTFEYIKKRFMINNNCIDYIRLDENVGGSAGFYKGIQEALNYNAEWIGISDDDAIYQPDFFEKIFQVVNQNAEIKAFTGSVYLPNGKIQTSHRRRVIDSDTLKQKEVDKEEYQANFLLDVFTFVGVVLSTKLIKKIGLPEKDYFIWYDDSEYSLRARKYTDILNVSDAKIVHKVSVVNNHEPSWKEYYGQRNRIITEKKYTTNMLKLNIYNWKLLIRKFISIGLKKKYKGYRLYFFKSNLFGFLDGSIGKKGKSRIFFPGMKIK